MGISYLVKLHFSVRFNLIQFNSFYAIFYGVLKPIEAKWNNSLGIERTRLYYY